MNDETFEYTRLEEALKATLRKLDTKTDEPSHGNWTKFVVDQVASAAEEHGCTLCGHGCGAPEFMFDMTWLKTGDDRSLLDVTLILECEWGADHHVLEDFRKLLLGRADVRLLVFEGKTLESSKQLISKMRDEIHGFHKTIAGDRYLFAYWPKDANGFQFDHYVA